MRRLTHAILILLATSSILIRLSTPTNATGVPSSTTPITKTLIITHGGTYTGTWSSDDPHTPAVLIKTADPVVIENASITSRGHLIATGVSHVKVTVRNTRGVGLNPNIAGRAPGRFFTGEDFDSVTIENCDLQNTAGIYLLEYGGDFSPAQSIQILRNNVKNIDGRRSDGRSGFAIFNHRAQLAKPADKMEKGEDGFVEVQFVQLDKVRHVPNVEIAWNQVINEPGNSRVEDNINIYLSSGTPASPIKIHDNYIQGAFTITPWEADRQDDQYRHDNSYSGGGILLGDGSSPTVEEAAAYVEAFNNQVIGTSNYGIAISAGHDLVFHHNRIISAGVLPDGRSIPTQNTGAYIWDINHDASKTPPTFYNNTAHDNQIAWVKRPTRNDAWHPDAAGWTNNTYLPGPITVVTEQAEWTSWLEKLATEKVKVGSMNGKPP